MISSISQGSGGGLMEEVLRSLRKGQEEMLEEAAVETVTAANAQFVPSHATSSNVMSRNFFDRDYQKSEYIQASLTGFQLDKSQQNKMASLVTSIQADMAIIVARRKANLTSGGIACETTADPKYICAYMANQRGQHRLDNIQNEEEVNASEDALEKNKQRIEEKAREAVTPIDANGNPIELATPGSSGEAAPMPEISGSNPAPAPNAARHAPAASTAAAPEIAFTPALAPEVSTLVVPSSPSIDIIV